MNFKNNQWGVSLVEAMIALVVFSLVIAGVMTFYVAHQRVAVQEGLSASVEGALRKGMSKVTDAMRNGGFGVPPVALASWIPWVSGFAANPNVTDGIGGAPDELSIATCGTRFTTTLSAASTANATTLSLNSTAGLDTGNRRLINIGYSENAWVTAVTAGTVSIDAEPSIAGVQGLKVAYPVGTTICRVDVDSYSVDTSNNRLLLDPNDGTGPQIAVDDILDFQVVTLSVGKQYRVTVDAIAAQLDPETHQPVVRRMSSTVSVRN